MATKTQATRIQLKGEGVQEEGRAASAITPGQLISLDSDGELIPHAVAGGAASPSFALEDALQGRTIEDNYAIGELVTYGIGRPGDVYLGWGAAGEDIANGDKLSSNGDGTFKVAGSTDVRLAEALEDLDLTETGAENGRLRVRLL